MTDTTDQVVEQPAPDANVAPETETVADPSPAVTETDDSEAPKPKGVQKRLDELTRNWREEQRRNEQLMALLQQRHEPPKVEPPPQDFKPKTLADFEYDEAKYQSYLLEQVEQRAIAAAERKLKEQQERETAARRTSTFQQREADFAKTVSDYHEVTRNPSLPITQAIVEAIADSDDGPALAYHLGKNPDVTARIASLPPTAAARELGRIEARLAYEREKAKDKPVVSKAPPPPPKIDAADPKVEKDPSEMSDAEFSKWFRRRRGLKT